MHKCEDDTVTVLRTVGILFLLASMLLPTSSFSRTSLYDTPKPVSGEAASPSYAIAAHTIGKLALSVCNNGTFGDGFSPTCNQDDCIDYFTYEAIPCCEYPKGSGSKYLFAGAFWIGAIVNRDTLVSVGADGWSSAGEFNPDHPPLGNMIFRSTIDPAKPEFAGAISEQDYTAVYYDTCRENSCPWEIDYLDGRGHRPLNIEVTQRSFAWSYEYAEDFVLFDFGIRNMGHERLKEVYMGIYVDADIHQAGIEGDGAQDDICGFRETFVAQYLEPIYGVVYDTVNIAWTADDGRSGLGPGGDPLPNNDDGNISVNHITATRIVRTPNEELDVSFNWWISNVASALDYGPQAHESARELETGGKGTPEGDRNKYHFLRNGEFDFDQVMTYDIQFNDPMWETPPQDFVDDWSNGLDTRYLLSFGPFSIEEGQTLPISLAYVAGEDFHTDPSNADNLANDWRAYYEGVDFSDLAANATWADWLYDNPGVDTDGDGYYGEYHFAIDSNGDTLKRKAYKGDGVPDWKGAGPPPAPFVRIVPTVGSIGVLFNGSRSENTPDNFSDTIDFEGYRIYCGRDERRSSYSIFASYDVENYNKYTFTYDEALETSDFLLLDFPFTLERLKELYSGGNPDWNPESYSSINSPFIWGEYPDSIFYFEPQDFNRSVLRSKLNDTISWNSPIMKVWPDAPKPPDDWLIDTLTLPDSIWQQGLDTAYLDEDGYWKYYDYEYTIEDLLPTVPYWVNVTAFDFGSPTTGLPPLESNPTIQPKISYPLELADDVAAKGLEVFVYPNPYRLDGDYADGGYENRLRDRAADRARLIHFANLPERCTITIYSLDGDMIQEINHPSTASTSACAVTTSHECWNLITRNAQLVASGLYYWTVEDLEGNVQIGKMAIIM
ncbi:MAG: hypothetical protein DRP45_05905 [Candidatus Zixiibacteriota bacterium]|nr:MAG: hypothetical protein DRP45_05905 [candidate division Zixibacteria bacterium]